MSIHCDILIIGGGHAGAEAALAAARLGCATVLLTPNPRKIARMPCNPSIGGPAKAHLVREIDALGGEMARAIDDTHIHIRNLNTGKGPAVQALRAQADRPRYAARIQAAIAGEENLRVVADEAASLLTTMDPSPRVQGAITTLGQEIRAGAVVVTTGTFLSGVLHLGHLTVPGGRSGEGPSSTLSRSLADLGLRISRLKTGTCPRIDRDSINTQGLDILHPSKEGLTFSDLSTPHPERPQIDCWITRTNELTRRTIHANLHRSPLYGGVGGGITGRGPRYCPSLEDKFMRFPEREFHLVFLEPEGFSTPEVYLQGVSTSMPVDVQLGMVRSLPGLEHAVILKPGYAVEYDYSDPTQLTLGLQVRGINGLFMAGQINGTSGYEEAAAQGLLAGINAVRSLQADKEPITLGRQEAYLGVLVDDLVCRGTKEPYRMHTSRAEYRLLLREDNADDRLTPLGHEIGLVDERRWSLYSTRRVSVAQEIDHLERTHISAEQASNLSNALELNVAPGITLADLVRRPTVSLALVRQTLELEPLPVVVAQKVEVALKYDGYIQRQQRQVAKQEKVEHLRIPADLSFAHLAGLSAEAVEKLNAIRPINIGQASRIPGISPSDISAILIQMRKRLNHSGERGAGERGAGECGAGECGAGECGAGECGAGERGAT